jgi:hypothetical protein
MARVESGILGTVDFTAREAIRTPAFWFISLGHGSAMLVTAVMVHTVVDVTERLGSPLHQASVVVALMTAMQMLGQLSASSWSSRTPTWPFSLPPAPMSWRAAASPSRVPPPISPAPTT